MASLPLRTCPSPGFSSSCHSQRSTTYPKVKAADANLPSAIPSPTPKVLAPRILAISEALRCLQTGVFEVWGVFNLILCRFSSRSCRTEISFSAKYRERSLIKFYFSVEFRIQTTRLQLSFPVVSPSFPLNAKALCFPSRRWLLLRPV